MVRRWRRGRPPRGEASRAERRAGLRALGAPPLPAPARPPARPGLRPPAGRAAAGSQREGAGGAAGFMLRGEGAPRAAGAGEASAARREPEGHCCPGVSGRLSICSLLPILSASGPRSPRSGEAKAAAAAAWLRGGEGGERAGRRNLAETEAKALKPRESSRARLGEALRRALRRGPTLAPERRFAGRQSRRWRPRAGRPRRGRAAGRRNAVRGARIRSEATRSPRPRALQSSRRVTWQSCFEALGAPHPSTGGRAGRCVLRGPLLRPPASSSRPPSPCLPARAGGARGAGSEGRSPGGALLAPGCSHYCGGGGGGSSAEKSRNGAGALAALPLAPAAGPEESGRVAAASPRPAATLSAEPAEEESSLCPLFYSPRFFSQVGKSRTISVSARALR